MSQFRTTSGSEGATAPHEDLYHLTLQTGNVRHSPRCEVTDDTLRLMVAWLLDQGIAPEQGEVLHQAPVPMYSPYICRSKVIRRCLAVTLHHPKFGDVLKFYVAAAQRDGAAVWSLHLRNRGPQPSAPWCAVKLLPGLGLAVLAQEDVFWFADFERCVAWAWVELLQTKFI